MRKLLAAASGVVLAAGVMIAAAPPSEASTGATAATSCPGAHIDTIALKVIGGSAIWGNVELYWDSSTGRNCAKTVATSAGYYGTASYKSVILYRCVAGTKAGSSCQTDSQVADPGSTSVHYTYYAGPVSLAAAGRCIAVTGEVDNPGGTAFAALHTPAMHCS